MRRTLRGPAAPCRTTARWLQVALLAAVAVALPAAAAVYKWTDANGRVVYSDQPPPDGAKAEQLQGPQPPANPHAVREMANQEAELKKRQQERSKQSDDEARRRAEADQRTVACARAEAQIRTLGANQQVVYRLNEKGERVALDDATRVKERLELERWMKANSCAR
jgi:Skp family chaperone for outer membrane proteins